MQEIGAKIIHFSAHADQWLDPTIHFFSTLGPNNFQTVIDSENARNQLRTMGKMKIP